LYSGEPPSSTGEGFWLYADLLLGGEVYGCALSISVGFAAATLLNAKSRFETIGLVYLDRKRE